MPELSLAEILAFLGANVHRLRTALTITQQDLEAQTGLSVQSIRKIERGKTNITLDTLRRLANALDVAPNVLLRRAKLPPAKPGRPRKRPAHRKR
jgi:transcriptional regulator with XRE-family HTH domain